MVLETIVLDGELHFDDGKGKPEKFFFDSSYCIYDEDFDYVTEDKIVVGYILSHSEIKYFEEGKKIKIPG